MNIQLQIGLFFLVSSADLTRMYLDRLKRFGD